MFETRYTSSLLLILMGSMDCLTTIIGVRYFGTIELNPLVAGILDSSLPAFVAMKLAITVSVGLILVFVEKALMETLNKTTKAFRATTSTVKIILAGLIFFLAIVVINNIIVIIRSLG